MSDHHDKTVEQCSFCNKSGRLIALGSKLICADCVRKFEIRLKQSTSIEKCSSCNNRESYSPSVSVFHQFCKEADEQLNLEDDDWFGKGVEIYQRIVENDRQKQHQLNQSSSRRKIAHFSNYSLCDECIDSCTEIISFFDEHERE